MIFSFSPTNLEQSMSISLWTSGKYSLEWYGNVAKNKKYKFSMKKLTKESLQEAKFHHHVKKS